MSNTGTEQQRPTGEVTLKGGRYTLTRKIAEGGTAFVYLAWDDVEKTWRAVKTLLPEYAKRPALRHRFENEARTMLSLVHPNIVTVHDAGQEGEVAWIVMELAVGGSVIDWVERHGKMPPRLGCQVVADVAKGMVFAHERGIIHRDIKPQNVLVDERGTSKITDFGIAQVVEETRVTMTGTVMGTLGYMAPEQHESAKHADARADIYSLAATLYTLLMGEAPTHLFMADDRDFEGIPAAVTEVIRKGSQYRRELRYDTMSDFGAALEAAMEGLPPDPVVPSLVPPVATQNSAAAGGSRMDGTFGGGAAGGHALLAHDAPIVSVPPAPLRISSASDEPATPSLARITLNNEPDPGRAMRLRPKTAMEDRVDHDRRRKVGAVLLGLVSVIAFAVSLVVVVGATRVGGFDTLRLHADAELQSQVHEERVILDTLKGLAIPEYDGLRKLFDECEHGTEAEREATTNRLIATLDQIRRDLEGRRDSRQEHIVKQLKETVRRIQGRLAELRDRNEKLAEIRASPSGRAATLLGF